MGWNWGVSFTKKELLRLLALVLVYFTCAICASLQGPFYPREAEKKGATATEYGLVFGIFELVAFVSCPFFGKYMGKMGAKFVLNSGIIVTALSTILFGLLDLVDDRYWFISVSFLVRILESLGASAAITSVLGIVILIFPETFTMAYTILEVMQGVAYMLGPTVGGFLFGLGGFPVPFITVGVLILLVEVLILFVLADIDDYHDVTKPTTNILTVLKIAPVLLDAFSVFIEALSVGFLAASLEPHLRIFDLSPVTIGIIFVINGTVYTITAPMVGLLCNNGFNMRKLIMLGSLITIGAFCLIGPIPYTSLPTTLWMVCLGLVLDGVGMGFMFVPSFLDTIQSVIAYGLPDDISTYTIATGLYASAFALGAFAGPSVAGILLDFVGFRKGTIFVLVVHSVLYVVTGWFLCTDQQPSPNVSGASSPGTKRKDQLSPSWTHDTDREALLDDDKGRGLVDGIHLQETDSLSNIPVSSKNKTYYGSLTAGITEDKQQP